MPKGYPRDHLFRMCGLLVTLREAKCLLASFSVEDIRRLMEAGAFSAPLSAELKTYLFTRITQGDLTHDRSTEGQGDSP